MSEVATTILAQLGGSRFIAMTGTKNFLNGGDYLQFDLPRGVQNKANKCRVALSSWDTYSMTFYKWNARKLEMVVVSEHDGLYFDQLQTVFTSETGFDTHL